MLNMMSKKLLSGTLLAIGLVLGLFSLYYPSMGLNLLAVALIITGIFIMILNLRKRPGTPKIAAYILVVLSAVLISAGCTVKVPMAPAVPQLDIKDPFAIEAALLIPEKTKNYVFTGKPESLTGAGRPHEFPLGEALETASVRTFSQVFKRVTLVRTPAESAKFKAVIEPEIREFHFEYDQLSYVGFAIAVLSKITVKITLMNGEEKIFERILESPQQKKGPWMIKTDYEVLTGESASDALVYTLKTIALEMFRDPAILRLTNP